MQALKEVFGSSKFECGTQMQDSIVKYLGRSFCLINFTLLHEATIFSF